MKAKKRFHKEETSNHAYFSLKICDNKDHIAFLWENYKSSIYSKRLEHTLRCYIESASKFQPFPEQ